MKNVPDRRPFSKLGDQQLLDQTKRLAANQRELEVRILDHLDEIDRRGLALRRGYSSLFDYAVRELRFTDAAAQRRIQTMRLCRRHEWVRAKLQSGELNLTAAAQLETAFAGAERQCRQPATQGEARQRAEQGRSVGSQPGDARGPEAEGEMAGAAAPTAPATTGAVAVDQGAPSPRDAKDHENRRGATPSAAPQSAPGLAPTAGQSGDAAAVNTPAEPVASHAVAQDRDAGHAGSLLAQPELNGIAAPFPASPGVPVASSSDDGPTPQLQPPANLAAPVPLPVMAPSESLHTAALAESFRDDSIVEVSPPPLSAAPLLHPQRQRELIEQAAGMSTRQVAGLLAATAPEVVSPRDTLRAVAPDRYTLKVSIDQECEQGLRLLKDLRSHLDPRMSWGDLVARLVREAVARHDPRVGGGGQRRRRRAGNADASPERAPKRTRAAAAPAAAAQRGGSATPAPQGEIGAASGQTPAPRLPATAPPRPPAPAAPASGARQDTVPLATPETAAAAKFTSGTAPDGTDAAPLPPGAPPEPAVGVAPPDGKAAGAPSGLASQITRDAAHGPRRSPPRRPIPAAVRRHVWQRDGGRCGYRDPLTGRRCSSSHLLQIDHLLPVAQGGGAEPDNLQLACFAHHRMRHGHGPAPPPEPPR